MINNIVYNNAYGILGLLPNASQKEISRRYKEIEKFLQIGENPEYDNDFNFYSKFRTLQNIHNAFFNISNINNQILHHFFRVYANNEEERQVLENIEKDFTYEKMVYIYKESKKTSITIKNIAIVLTILLLSENVENVEKLSEICINCWHIIVNKEKFIKDYKKIFLLDDELGIEESLLDNFEESIIKELILIFSDISKLNNNNQILSKFINKFQLNDNIFNIDTVEEIYDNIYKSIKILDSLDISEDGVFDDNEKRTIKTCLQSLQDEFNKLSDLGLYENEKTVILRDLVATKIRIQILDLFNNLSENETALRLMQFAINVVGTKGLKAKLEEELNSIQNNIVVDKYIKPLIELIKELKKEARFLSVHKITEYEQEIRHKYSNFKYKCTLPQTEIDKTLDVIAAMIRAVAIDLHNNHNKSKGAQILLKLAQDIAQTPDIKDQCAVDLVVVQALKGNNEDDKIGCFFWGLFLFFLLIVCCL